MLLLSRLRRIDNNNWNSLNSEMIETDYCEETQDQACTYGIQTLYSDDVAKCLSTDLSNNRRAQISEIYAAPENYSDYSEQLCGWNELTIVFL